MGGDALYGRSVGLPRTPLLTADVYISGYLASCKEIMGAAKRIERAVRTEIPELYVLGTPPASVVAFGSATTDVNIHAVGDAMSARGWHLNALVNPPGLHIAVTVSTFLVPSAIRRPRQSHFFVDLVLLSPCTYGAFGFHV